jgi:hypothetical protein
MNIQKRSYIPRHATPLSFTLGQRIFGPMYSHRNERLGLFGRLTYGWLYTDDPYFGALDDELREQGH